MFTASPGLSPTLTAASSSAMSPASTSTFATSSYQPEHLAKVSEEEEDGGEFARAMGMDDVPSFSDLLNYDEDDCVSSERHSPITMSPNRTPSPVLGAKSPVAVSPSPYFQFPSSPHAFSYDDPIEKLPLAGPSTIASSSSVTIKEEPIEFGWIDPTPVTSASTRSPVAVQPIASTSTSAVPQAATALANYPLQAQMLLLQLLQSMNTETLQQQYLASQAAANSAPQTIAPSKLLAIPQSAAVSNGLPTPVSPVPVPQIASSSAVQLPVSSAPAEQAVDKPKASSSSAASVPSKRRISEALEDILEDEPLKGVSPEDEEAARYGRSTSTFSFGTGDGDLNIEAQLELLVPTDAIFSGGKGKGGKKGGGMSSVVRAEDEDLDDDDSWRPSPEEYKKLSSKEKRQLRNKLSARAFRTRRKDYITTLEGHLRQRDNAIDAMKTELVQTKSENLDLRKELAALKASTMNILHPETALKPSPSPAVTPSVVMASQLPQAPRPVAPTPRFSTRKDLPSSPAIAKSFWGGNNPLGHHGNSIVHTLFTPEIGLPKRTMPAGYNPRPIDMPRENLNPRLNDTATELGYKSYPLAHESALPDMTGSFSEWSEDNAFSLRSVDSYRMQMWSRLTREAQAEKAGIAAGSRAKFFGPSASASPSTSKSTIDEAKPDLAARLAAIAQSELANKLADSFISAFVNPYGPEDRPSVDRLADLVTGRTRLGINKSKQEIEEENRRKLKSPTYEADEQLAMALGGLRLQSGFGSAGEYRHSHSWENPMGALADMLHIGHGFVRA